MYILVYTPEMNIYISRSLYFKLQVFNVLSLYLNERL